MATYLLLHGASSDSWYWHLVAPILRARGHSVVAPDLPCGDDSAGVAEYADSAVTALAHAGYRRDLGELVVVAQSMAGLVAPLVCARVAVNLLVLVAAMVPAPGETPGEWWAHTGYEAARREHDRGDGRSQDSASQESALDPLTIFFHDVAPEVVAEAMARGESRQSGTPFSQPFRYSDWPDVVTRFVLCRQDRFFPAGFLRRVVQERLGITPDEMDSGHLPALSHPDELAARLEAYRVRNG